MLDGGSYRSLTAARLAGARGTAARFLPVPASVAREAYGSSLRISVSIVS